MKKLLDKLILLICCLLLLFFTDIGIIKILALLTAVIVSSVNSYFGNKISIYICIGYCILCMFKSEFILFFPLISYDFFDNNKIWAKCIPFAAMLLNIVIISNNKSGFMTSYGIWGLLFLYCIISFMFQIKTERSIKNLEEFYQLRDKTKEESIHLEDKNKELMEKQDYEVKLATLNERNRIAREIHDNVGHMLTRSILQVGALEIIGKNNNIHTDMQREISALKDTLKDAMDNIRSSVHDLHDESIDLKIQIEDIIKEYSFCEVKLKFDSLDIPGNLKYCFIAVIKEALSNTAKHSDATQVNIFILEHPGLYQLIIQDNGSGKTRTDKGYRERKGIGLENMRERVKALGGTFYAEDSNGFRIFISISKEGVA